MKVHLGAFDQPADGWYNTDVTPHLFLARIPGLPRLVHVAGLMSRERLLQHRKGIFRKLHYLDITRRLPFRDNFVEAYFAGHVLEHLYIFETRHALSEIYRTLVPGGFVRLVLPDLELGLKLFDTQRPETFLRFLFENETPGLKKNQHRWMFTSPYLESLLRAAGFQAIWHCRYRESRYPAFEPLDSRPKESLYIEAQK